MMHFGGMIKTSIIDYPEKLTAVVFTEGCNFKCSYCHNGHLVKGESHESISGDGFFQVLEKRIKYLDGVVISGGEPTLHSEDLLDFMRLCKAHELLVKLDTNGTNPKLVHAMIEDGLLDYLALDIKAPFYKYDEVAMVKTNVEAVQETMKLIQEGKVAGEFRTTVVKELLTKEDVFQLIRDAGNQVPHFLQNFTQSSEILCKEKSYSPVDFLEEVASYFMHVKVR